MYMRDLWASLARRPFLVAVCLLATIGLTYVAAGQVKPTYESRADVVLVPPKSAEDPTINRYLSLGGLRQAVDVLTRSLGSDTTLKAVQKVAPQGTFEAQSDATTTAPILIVTTKAATPAQAQAILEAVLEQIPINLRELQDSVNIAKANQITPQRVATDDEPKANHKKQIRAVGAGAAFLLIVSALLVGAVDNRLLRRDRDREIAEQEALLRLESPPPSPKRSVRGTGSPSDQTRKRNVVSAKARR